MDPQVPDHRKWERSETAELEAASEIGNIHCLRSPGHLAFFLSTSDTPPGTHQCNPLSLKPQTGC